MDKILVRDLGVKGQRVLARVDFNVPTKEIDGKIRITDLANLFHSNATRQSHPCPITWN